MRKSVAIGFVIVTIGLVAFVLSRPKKGTIEWHKREYLTACKGSWKERALNLGRRALGKQPSFSTEQVEKEAEHQRALIKLGFLEERELVFSNRPIDYIIRESSRFIRADP